MDADLLHLGPGAGSANEGIKAASNALRGSLADELASATDHLGNDTVQLVKFHGSYQQDDRDERRARRASGEKAYQFMVRARIPGGALDARQYLALDDLAGRLANGSLRLTTRQGIQFHGVLKSSLKPVIAEINETLLTTLAACGDVNRNVMTCPAPPRNRGDEQLLAYANALAERLTPRTRAYHDIWLDGERAAGSDDEPLYGATYLPRKFKIAIARAGDNCVDVMTQDLGFIAELDDGGLAGFTVTVGGGLGSTHGKEHTYARLATPLAFVSPAEVVDVAEAVVALYRDRGDRVDRKHARLKYLVEERGIDWVRAEVERRLGRRLADPRPIAFEAAHDHLGWTGSDAAWALGVHVPCGRIADRGDVHLRSALRAAIENTGVGVTITPQQNLLLHGSGEHLREAVHRVLHAYGVEIDPGKLGLARDAMACPALPTCGLAVAEAERALPGVLAQIAAELDRLGARALHVNVRMTGCPNACARPRTAEIGIIGRSLNLYDLYVGADAVGLRLNLPYAQSVRLHEIGARLRPLLEQWVSQRRVDEGFGEYVNRTGVDSPVAV